VKEEVEVSSFWRFIDWLDRMDEAHIFPALCVFGRRFDAIFGGGSGPYE